MGKRDKDTDFNTDFIEKKRKTEHFCDISILIFRSRSHF